MGTEEIISTLAETGGMAVIAGISLFIIFRMVMKWMDFQDKLSTTLATHTEVMRQHSALMREVQDLLRSINGKS